jgi:hypothetical protein
LQEQTLGSVLDDELIIGLKANGSAEPTGNGDDPTLIDGDARTCMQ